jgi:hypothetical protein
MSKMTDKEIGEAIAVFMHAAVVFLLIIAFCSGLIWMIKTIWQAIL